MRKTDCSRKHKMKEVSPELWDALTLKGQDLEQGFSKTALIVLSWVILL